VKIRFYLMAFLSLISVVAVVGCLSDGAKSIDSASEPSRSTAPLRQEASLPHNYTTLKVYYCTNRKDKTRNQPLSSLEPEDVYGGFENRLNYGNCVVSIPESHRYGEIERPSSWKLEFCEDPNKHIVLQSVNPASEEQILVEISQDVGRSRKKQAFVFVHGYNVNFADAANRTAQMAYDLKFDGPPIFFSWPSEGKWNRYETDLENASLSGVYLQRMLEEISRNTGAREIHLIAHSMGTRVLTDALDGISQFSAEGSGPRFNQILLAAPDLDAKRFRDEIAPRIVGRADRLTIYASSNDRALIASQKYHNKLRLGQGGDRLTLFPPELTNIDVVDVSNLEFEWFDLGHSMYGNQLLTDIRKTLDGVPAPQRQLKPLNASSAWIVRSNDALQPVNYTEEKELDRETAPEPRKSIWQRLMFWR
jgi:esterase/lipase superfamily enzyme